MNNCGPLEDETCEGSGLRACQCFCDQCESHDLECQGCKDCNDPAEPVEDEPPISSHSWTASLDHRYYVCEMHPGEVMIKPVEEVA